MSLRNSPLALIAAAALAAGCGPTPAPARDQQPPAPAADAATPPAASASDTAVAPADTSEIARLEREARALAHAEGCTAGQCRTAPVGSRPCGGPRTYLVYCAATTDSAALFAKLEQLARAEQAHNQASGMASTCEFREPPGTTVQAGRCVAAPAQGVGMP